MPTRSKVAAIVLMAASLALTGCTETEPGDKAKSSSHDAASPSSPSPSADLYAKAPGRIQVVHLLEALRTPQDGTYRTWMSDDATYWTQTFIYTPRSTSEPGWDKRDNEGTAVTYPGKLTPAEKDAFFKSLTRDNTIIASTLKVVRVEEQPVGTRQDYRFTFKLQTSGGDWLTGMAMGAQRDEAGNGKVTRLSYDTKQS
ncbi:hypothetical protein MTF65_20665 [Streptomyces sp. APSN-46.1]|uniref:hypothetical protein n=1 Tax=Streptomyces sp. APSN-46.1 TaxID=2929049 RepID=UPI001FB457A8|nr:hypothetical protein [Streptomyces sp. APSN-46.1]MCJ1679710.1 hypothetical protein [Streptomyces sp. APSN-46.1]